MKRKMMCTLLCMTLLFSFVHLFGIPAQAATYKLYYNANTSADVFNMPPTMSGQDRYEIPAYYYSEDDGAVHNGVPTRFKYTFCGWSENKNASEPDYVPGNTIILSKNTTLYAVWKFGIKTAQTFTTNGSCVVTTSFPGQEQWIKIKLDDSANYWSKTGTSQIWSAAEGDPIGELYDADGYYLEGNDNTSLGYNDKNFRIPYTFSKSTTYYLSVTTDYSSSVYDDQTESYMPETVVVDLDKVQNRYNAKFYDTFASEGSGSLWRTITLFDNYMGTVPSYGFDEVQSMYIDNFLGWNANSGDVLFPGNDLYPKSQTLTTVLEEWEEFPTGVVCGTIAMLSFGRQICWYSFTPLTSGSYDILLWEGDNRLKCSIWEGVETKYFDAYPNYDAETGLKDYSVYLESGKTYYIGVRPLVYFEGAVDMEYVFEICRAAKLSYDANGGSGAPAAQTGSYQYTIPSKEPTRSGYTFTGWSTTPNNEEDFLHEPGNIVEVNAAATLYAQWSRIGKPPYWGDVNGDNKINSLDITLISKDIANLETLTAEQACFGDVNLDGKTNISDVTTIAQYIAGTISAFPCEAVADITVVPPKTQYTKGEALKTSGTRILVRNRNSSVSYELTDNISISGYNPNTVGTQTLTATYRGLKLTFTVTVKDNTYTLSYNASGGTGAPSPQTGSTSYIIPMVIPTRFGWNFAGWMGPDPSNPGYQTYFYPGDTITITKDTTLNASWERSNFVNESELKLDVKYPGQMKYRYHTPKTSGKYVLYSYGSEDTEGYLYDSSGKELARNDDGGSGTNFRIAYNLTAGIEYYIGVKYHSSTQTGSIYCYFGPVYTVSYNANGGSGAPSSQEKDFNKDLTLSSSAPSNAKSYTITYNANGGSVSQSTKTVNYVFRNWNTSSSGTGISYNAGANYTNNANVTLYAQWTNPTAGTLATPMRSGYTFDGWYTASSGGTKITSSTTITENKTLYAHWTPNVYTVRFNGNGATSGSMSNQTFTYDVAQNLTANAFKRAYTVSYNYNGATGGNSASSTTATSTFNGWATSASGAKVYNDKQNVKNLTDSGTYNLYANWTVGTITLPTPTKTGSTFGGWYTNSSLTNYAGSGGAKYTPSANITLYAKWTPNANIYNLGEETYSFKNYGDSDSPEGHCFGMSMTSAGYYTGKLDKSIISLSDNNLYAMRDTAMVRAPICHYQAIQGPYSTNATVAGGSYYKTRIYNISSDWSQVVNYVKNHQYDGKGSLQIGFRKDNEGGHAINFLRYEEVNGQQRIYAYDNNKPNTETYFYKDASGRVYQTPGTFSGSIDCIALRDVAKYYASATGFDRTRYIYAESGTIIVEGSIAYPMETDTNNGEFYMYEVPKNASKVTIVPLVDGASFEYVNHEYSFGKVDDDTYGTIALIPTDDYHETATGGNDIVTDFAIKNAPSAVSIKNYTPTRTEAYKTTMTFTAETVDMPSGASVHWFINGTDRGTGDKFTVEKATSDYTVQVKVLDKNGNVLSESETETVKINSGFFARLKAFFRGLFGLLPKVTQEYLGFDFIDKMLP